MQTCACVCVGQMQVRGWDGYDVGIDVQVGGLGVVAGVGTWMRPMRWAVGGCRSAVGGRRCVAVGGGSQ